MYWITKFIHIIIVPTRFLNQNFVFYCFLNFHHSHSKNFPLKIVLQNKKLKIFQITYVITLSSLLNLINSLLNCLISISRTKIFCIYLAYAILSPVYVIWRYTMLGRCLQVFILCWTGLLAYLLSDTCDIFNSRLHAVTQDMDQPLSHYFINSSHKTWVQVP